MHGLRAATARQALRSRIPYEVRYPILQIRTPPRILRCYATEDRVPVEPPDYLDERELRVFETIKRELRPLKLDVSGYQALKL